MQEILISSMYLDFTNTIRTILLIRYQILILLAIVALGYWGSKSPLFRGLFAIPKWYSISITILTSLLATRACILSSILALNNAPKRYEVECILRDNSLLTSSNCLEISGHDWRTYIPTVFFALFIIVPTFTASKRDFKISREIKLLENKSKKELPLEFGLLTGTAISIAFFSVGYSIEEKFNLLVNSTAIKNIIIFVYKVFGVSQIVPNNKLTITQSSTLFFFISLLLFHMISGRLLRPDLENRILKSPPTIFFALLLLSWSVLFLSWLSFVFDYYRFPILVGLPLFTIFVFWISKDDYLFEVFKCGKDETKANDNKENILEKRISKIPENKPKNLIVICAAGGGIQASAWTAKVLSSLAQNIENFQDSIGLISGVSGGAVGSMFFLEGIIPKTGVPDSRMKNEKPNSKDDEYDKIVEAASSESLDATGWGFAHADFWRFIGLGWIFVKNKFLRNKFRDRGWAIEQNWKESFINRPNQKIKLSEWREIVKEGDLPIPIFNATLVENGSRLLISPIPLKLSSIGNNETHATDIFNLYGDSIDMDVTTAVRLSSSFPYVSPISRASYEHGNIDLNAVHIGDGGYFDNFGVFSALECLKGFNLDREKTYTELGIEKVLFLQIISFPNNQGSTTNVAPANGWLTSLLGPASAAINVREGAQQDSANAACQAFKNAINTPGNERFVHHTIYFKQDNYNPPLSWKLSQEEINQVHDAWEQISENEINTINKFLNT